MTTAAILQPSYLSWPGHFYWMKHCDVFIFLDDAQFTRQDWRNRNFIKTTQGKQLLTVPVHWYGNSYAPINTIEIANEHQWAKKHLQALRLAYSRAPYFKQYFPYFEGIFSKRWERLSDLTIATMKDLAEFLEIRPRFIISSELKIETDNSTDKLVKLCQVAGAKTYLAGKRGYENYIEHRYFEEAGIKIIVKDYAPIEYPQLWGSFISHLSVVDLLFNCGPHSVKYLEEKADTIPAVKGTEDYQVLFWKNEYDSRFFKRDIFSFSSVEDEHPEICSVANLRDSKTLPAGFIIGRVSSDRGEVVQAALASGFEVICQMSELEQDLHKEIVSEVNTGVAPAVTKDYESLVDIAGKVFSFTRFHRDRNLSKLADEYHREWLRNCLAGKQADTVLVVKGDKPEGFIALKYNPDYKRVRIVLIGVATDKQGKGIGNKLLAAGREWARKMGARQIFVRTETDNRALGFYLKNGFRLRENSVYLRKDNS